LEITEKKKKKTTKENKTKMQRTTRRDLNCKVKLQKINQLIPHNVDGYCNFRKIPDDYRSKVKDRITRNYNGHILRRCIGHGLTQDEERGFTPKPCDFDYVEKNIPETYNVTEQHSTNDYLSFRSSESINSYDTSTKTISAENKPTTQTMKPLSTQATLLNTF
jgi:hypothetical protein